MAHAHPGPAGMRLVPASSHSPCLAISRQMTEAQIRAEPQSMSMSAMEQPRTAPQASIQSLRGIQQRARSRNRARAAGQQTAAAARTAQRSSGRSNVRRRSTAVGTRCCCALQRAACSRADRCPRYRFRCGKPLSTTHGIQPAHRMCGHHCRTLTLQFPCWSSQECCCSVRCCIVMLPLVGSLCPNSQPDSTDALFLGELTRAPSYRPVCLGLFSCVLQASAGDVMQLSAKPQVPLRRGWRTSTRRWQMTSTSLWVGVPRGLCARAPVRLLPPAVLGARHCTLQSMLEV